MRKNGFCRVAAGLLAALLLSGCGAQKQKGFTPKLDTTASIQLDTLGFFGNFEAFDQVTNDFNKYYPNITFTYQQVGTRTLEGYLDLNPDVDIFMVSSEFMNTGNSAMLSRCMDLTDIDLGAIDAQMLKLYNFDGVQKAIPMSQNVGGMVVNTTLLKKEGLTIPTNTQEFLATLAALKGKGYAPIQGPSSKVLAELTQSRLFSTLCAESGKPTAEKLVPIFEFLDTVLEKGYTDMAVNDTLPEDNYDGAILHFFEGNTPFWICNSEKVSGMKKRESKSEAFQKAPFEYTFAYVPLGEDGSYIYQEPWFGFAVGKSGKNSEYAMEFLRFLATGSEIDTIANVKGVPSVAREPNIPAIYQQVESPEALSKRTVNTGEISFAMSVNWQRFVQAYVAGEYNSPESAAQAFLDTIG